MDILKLLTRSAKKTQWNSSGRASNKLPSAGDSSNPQLYHDSVSGSTGKKRKREEAKTESQDLHHEDEGLDFFAPEIPSSKSKGAALEQKPSGGQHNSETAAKLLDEEECRQILRSHRLKVTLLPSDGVHNKNVKKSHSKTKSSKKKGSTKDQFKQLYPQPLTTFEDLRTTYGISRRLGENLVKQGYRIPTEVQMGSLPLLLQPQTALGDTVEELGSESLSAVDLLTVAPTGSGKTLAYLIPVVDNIMQRRSASGDKGTHQLQAVIVAPTKELASQIVNEAKKLTIGIGIKVVGMRKGMRVTAGRDSASEESSSENEVHSDEESTNDKSKKITAHPLTRADILVTTPLILLHALSTSSSEQHSQLPTVCTLILDEADVLLDPLFRDQTVGIWEACTNRELQVTLWSATMGSNIEALVSETIHERRERLGLDTQPRVVRLVVGLKDSAIPNITHKLIYTATEAGKLIALRQLLHPTAMSTDATQSLRPPFLVFTQTIPRAVALHSELLYDIPAEAGGSSRIAVLHSDLSDFTRDHVMTRFRNGEIWVLITTDILSRGVDFRGINGVVNYDVPNTGALYIHRVGRTGRAGRNGGVAVTFYTAEDIPYVRNIANIIAASEKQAGKPPSELSMKKWLLDALPKPSKEEKKKLKLHGVEARRAGLSKGLRDGKAKMKISTKSGYERKLENKRRGAIQGSKRRTYEAQVCGNEHGDQDAEDSEWAGIDE